MEKNDFLEDIEKIDKLLDHRKRVFPLRGGEEYNELQNQITEFTYRLINSNNFQTIQFDQQKIDNVDSWINSPIFICGEMKSGTSLIVNLLDSHSNLMVLPSDSHYAEWYEKWQTMTYEQLASHWMRRFVNPDGQEPFWFFGKNINSYQQFLQYLWICFMKEKRESFQSVVIAACIASDQIKKPLKYWVEKTPYNERHVPLLVDKYPKAKFIHVLRDPLTNITSLKKLSNYRKWKFNIEDVALRLKEGFSFAQLNQEKLGQENYFIYQYEDLVKNPHDVLHRICDFIKIPYEQVLTIPTQNGIPAEANSMYPDRRIQGKIINKTDDKKYLKELSRYEIVTILDILWDEAIVMGYDWTSIKKTYRYPLLIQKLKHLIGH